MTVNDAITKLKVMLGATEETVVELKFAEAELVDGTQVYAEGEIEPGAILFVRAGEGADPKIHLRPAGVHETTTGLLSYCWREWRDRICRRKRRRRTHSS